MEGRGLSKEANDEGEEQEEVMKEKNCEVEVLVQKRQESARDNQKRSN